MQRDYLSFHFVSIPFSCLTLQIFISIMLESVVPGNSVLPGGHLGFYPDEPVAPKCNNRMHKTIELIGQSNIDHDIYFKTIYLY